MLELQIFRWSPGFFVPLLFADSEDSCDGCVGWGVGGGGLVIEHMAVRFERAYRFAPTVPAEDEGPSHSPTSLAL